METLIQIILNNKVEIKNSTDFMIYLLENYPDIYDKLINNINFMYYDWRIPSSQS